MKPSFPQAQTYRRDPYSISTDPVLLDLQVIHSYLAQSYWSPGIPFNVVEKSIRHSLCFGVYFEDEQVGFARVITDFTTFGYLADVFILKEHRGQGLGKWLVECVLDHPQLAGFRRWLLATKDAHGLYAQFGFRPLANPDRMMEISHPEVYQDIMAVPDGEA